MTPEIETRTAAIEFRATAGRVLEGYAAVFGIEADIAGLFRESIRAGAFSASIAGPEPIFLLAHHDFAAPLARSGNDTLTLSQDAKGLHFRADVAATRAGDDVLALVRSGIVTGASIGFRVPEGGDVWPTRDRRELIRVDLIEVSVVARPAFAATSVSARARAHAGGPGPWRTWLDGARR